MHGAVQLTSWNEFKYGQVTTVAFANKTIDLAMAVHTAMICEHLLKDAQLNMQPPNSTGPIQRVVQAKAHALLRRGYHKHANGYRI